MLTEKNLEKIKFYTKNFKYSKKDKSMKLLKLIFCLSPFLNSFHYRHSRSNNALITFILRAFIAYGVFFFLSIDSISQPIYLCWAFLDGFNVLHSILKTPITGILKYKVGIFLLFLQSFLEIIAILDTFNNLNYPFKHIFATFAVFYIILVKILFNYRNKQLAWFNKRKIKVDR